VTGLQQVRIARAVFVVLVAGVVPAWVLAKSLAGETPDLLSAAWLQIAICALIAGWGGTAATLGRYLTAEAEGKRFNMKIELLKDMFVSGAVGAGAYWVGAIRGLDDAELGIVLLLSGFLGTRLLSAVGDKLLSIIAATKV
jgi:hypothetical protein